MPHTYYIVLSLLSEAPARSLRMSELASVCRSSQSRMSHAVDRMEERGWIRREPCHDDKRGFLAVLTDAGWEAVQAAAPGHIETVRRTVLDHLSDDQVRQLGEICQEVLRAIDPMGKRRVGDLAMEPAVAAAARG